MNTLRYGIVVVLSAILSAAWAQPEEKLYVEVPAAMHPKALGVQRIKDECAIAKLVGEQTYAAVRTRLPNALPLDESMDPGSAKVLQLTVVTVSGHGGGGWSGAKAVTVRVNLVQEDKVLKSWVRRASSHGVAFGLTMGTCDIFKLAAEELGRDIANWLVRAPTGESAPAAPAPESPGK